MLAFLKLALVFGKNYWKQIAVVVALLLTVFFIHKAITDYGDARYKQGVEDTLDKMKDQVAERNRINRDREQVLEEQIEKYAEEKEEERQDRRSEEEEIVTRVDTILGSEPLWTSESCAVTGDVLDARNAIRALGPGEN